MKITVHLESNRKEVVVVLLINAVLFVVVLRLVCHVFGCSAFDVCTGVM